MKSGIRQLLLLDDKGILIAGCDSIFSTEKYLNRPILFHFPLLDSIFPVIRRLDISDPEIGFAAVETTFPELDGVYDFTFLKMRSAQGEYILWMIEDHTTDYQQKMTEQQINNEIAIAEELLSRL